MHIRGIIYVIITRCLANRAKSLKTLAKNAVITPINRFYTCAAMLRARTRLLHACTRSRTRARVGRLEWALGGCPGRARRRWSPRKERPLLQDEKFGGILREPAAPQPEFLHPQPRGNDPRTESREARPEAPQTASPSQRTQADQQRAAGREERAPEQRTEGQPARTAGPRAGVLRRGRRGQRSARGTPAVPGPPSPPHFTRVIRAPARAAYRKCSYVSIQPY